ncbi:hypothetical protein NUSPORA_01102 [Nucleospora cyclopteri]
MEKLIYTIENEHIKFILLAINSEIKCEQGENTILTIEEEDFTDENIIKKLFEMAGEKVKLKEFKNLLKSASPKKNESKVLMALNFYNILKETVMKGTLKNYEFLKEQAENFKFIDFEFVLLQLTAGKIVKIETVEEMDKIYKETVNFGESERIICSGLRKHFKLNDLDQNTYLFLTNIKRAKLGCEFSEGMICCGSNSEKLEPIQVSNEFLGFNVELENQHNFFKSLPFGCVDFLKKEKYRKIMENFNIKNGKLYFKDKKCIIRGKEIILKTITEGTVS